MATPHKILIVGDEPLRAALREQFSQYPEIEALEAGSADEAISSVEREWPAAMIVAEGDGVFDAQTFAETARGAGFSGAIVLLGSQTGATPEAIDERLTRPFRFADLLARVRAHLAEGGATAAIGAHVLREDLRGLAEPGGTLTEKEAAILARLAQARGAVVPRDALLREVWGFNPNVTTRTLETHIYRLRRKIEADPARPALLRTEGGGYRLAAASKDEGE